MESDLELVQRFKKGEKEIFEKLVRRYQHKVYNTTYRMLGNREDAGDLAQETFIRVYQNLDRFKEKANFSTWLFRITTNLCRDQLRKRKREPATSSLTNSGDGEQEILIPDNQYSPEKVSIEQERKREIQNQLGKLPLEQREILILRDIQDFSYHQIAEILKISPGTVKSRLSRARRSLRDKLQGIVKGGITDES